MKKLAVTSALALLIGTAGFAAGKGNCKEQCKKKCTIEECKGNKKCNKVCNQPGVQNSANLGTSKENPDSGKK